MKRNNISKKRLCLIAASAMIIVIAAVGVTLAYLKAQTPEVVNTFTPTKIDTEIDETFDGKVKSDVNIENKGDIDAYVRAKIVINWVKYDPATKKADNTDVLPAEKSDYELVMGSAKWENIDGIYYYTEKVPAQAHTENLINSCKPLVEKDGYVLNVTILAEGIQSEPDTAITDAWGIDPKTWEKKAGVK